MPLLALPCPAAFVGLADFSFVLTYRRSVRPQILKSAHPEAREGLLKEAALLALLQHRNVVGLIGVVTVPRTMPAVLLLTFCEHGNLREFVAKGGANTATAIDTTMLLTFCADVAAGLHYLSSRRIVHRDVAARNVSGGPDRAARLLGRRAGR